MSFSYLQTPPASYYLTPDRAYREYCELGAMLDNLNRDERGLFERAEHCLWRDDMRHQFEAADISAAVANLACAITAPALSEIDAIDGMGAFASLTAWRCADCGADCDVSDDPPAIEIEAYGQVCERCADNWTTCERCDNWVPVDDTLAVSCETWCERCAERYSTRCHGCNSRLNDSADGSCDPNGDWYCDSCAGDQESWTSCDSCNCAVWYDDAIPPSGASGECLCRSCHREASRSACRNHDAKRSILGRSFRRIVSQRCFGVELETSACPNGDALFSTDCEFGATSFGAKPDGTDGVAKEFYSPILRGDRGLVAIENVCKFASANRWQVSRACGYHLHIDMRRTTDAERVAVLSGYAATREFWGALVPETRRSNHYCGIDQCLTNPADLLGASWDRIASRCGSRYAWLNVASAYSSHRTFEVRLHTGTLNRDKIVNWVRAHLLFVDWCIQFPGCQRTLIERFYDLSAGAPRPLAQQFDEMRLSAWQMARDLVPYYQQRARTFGADLPDIRALPVVERPSDNYSSWDV